MKKYLYKKKRQGIEHKIENDIALSDGDVAFLDGQGDWGEKMKGARKEMTAKNKAYYHGLGQGSPTAERVGDIAIETGTKKKSLAEGFKKGGAQKE